MRGRGRRFPGRGYRPYEMSGPGYYRIGEAAPERYDPSSAAPDGPAEHEDRWQKVDLEMEERKMARAAKADAPRQQDPDRVGAYVAEYDAHAALAGKEARERQKGRISSPAPRSPSSMKQSPSQPKCYRRPKNYRSASPSPSSK